MPKQTAQYVETYSKGKNTYSERDINLKSKEILVEPVKKWFSSLNTWTATKITLGTRDNTLTLLHTAVPTEHVPRVQEDSLQWTLWKMRRTIAFAIYDLPFISICRQNTNKSRTRIVFHWKILTKTESLKSFEIPTEKYM